MERPGGNANNHQVGDFSWMDQAIHGKKSFWQRCKEEPLVPVGCLLTAGVLFGGLFSFSSGRSKLSNRFMQARVVAQGGTVIAMGLGAYLASQERNKVKQQSYEDRQQIKLREQ